MRQILKSRLAQFGAIAVITYVMLVITVPNMILLSLMNSLFLGVVGMVTIVFFPLFIRALKDKAFDRVTQLTIGIILTWFSMIGGRIASVMITTTGEASRIAISPYIAAIAYLAIVGGILHVTAPGMVEHEWRYNKRLLVVGLLVGLLIASGTIFLQTHGHVIVWL